MSFAEIKEKFELLLQNPNVEEIRNEANELTREFYNLVDRKPARSEGEGQDGVDYIDDDHIEVIKQHIKEFRERMEKLRQERDKIEDQNLAEKKSIIQELTSLISEEENISKAYFKFNELKEKWRTIGNIPNEKAQEIQNEYSRLVELFHYNMNIYKELKENDLKKNIALKNDVIAKIESLHDKENLKEVEASLKAYQKEWDETGAVPKENWEEYRTKYWNAVHTVQGRLKEHYEERKQKQAQALEAKKALIEKTRTFVKEYHSAKEWETATNAVLAIQNEWKTVGYASKEENETVWAEFRAVCDEFFAKKKAFFEKLKEKASGLNAQKEAIIAKAEELKDSPEFKDTTAKILALQDEWKKIGGTGLKSDNVLWNKFRAACDHFFNRKKEFYATNELRLNENLKKKEEFIASLANVDLGDNPKEYFEKLKALGNQFKEIGDVPYKEKDRIFQEFQKAMDPLWEKAKIDRKEKEMDLFKERIELIKQGSNGEKQIYRERDFIRDKISKITEEIAQTENNLGFFSKSKNANPILDEYKAKIENLKKDLDVWKNKLKMLAKV